MWSSPGFYNESITFYHNTPSGFSNVLFYIYIYRNASYISSLSSLITLCILFKFYGEWVATVEPPVVSNFSWISTYWWVVVIIVFVIVFLSVLIIRRRLQRIRAYNRRIRNPALHLTFWRFWCCATVKEHGDDSPFWSQDYSSSDENDADDEDYDDTDSDDSAYSSSGSWDAAIVDADEFSEVSRKGSTNWGGASARKRRGSVASVNASDTDYDAVSGTSKKSHSKY